MLLSRGYGKSFYNHKVGGHNKWRGWIITEQRQILAKVCMKSNDLGQNLDRSKTSSEIRRAEVDKLRSLENLLVGKSLGGYFRKGDYSRGGIPEGVYLIYFSKLKIIN